MVAVLAAILDDPYPRLAGFQVGPHMSEDRWRNVRMAHEVVRCADQFLAGKTTDLDENIVAIGDDALEIGGRDQTLVRRKASFTLGYGLIVTHRRMSLSVCPGAVSD